MQDAWTNAFGGSRRLDRRFDATGFDSHVQPALTRKLGVSDAALAAVTTCANESTATARRHRMMTVLFGRPGPTV